jgi:putative transferase (TIGR04331 family)
MELRGLHEELLADLSRALNTTLGTHHSVRYWRILVGPWLQYFTQMLFDRWTMIHRAVDGYEISATKVLDLRPDVIIPANMNDFCNMYTKDVWNQAIYARILRGWTNVQCELVPVAEEERIAEPVLPESPEGIRGRIKSSFSGAATRLSQFAGRSTDAFLIATHLGLKAEVLLQLSMGQVPTRHRSVPAPQIAPMTSKRAALTLESKSPGPFGECIRALIPEQIPTVYLEGYEALCRVARETPWPAKPKVVFTSNCYHACDVFKEWAASQVERGTPLVIGQHGGNIGSAKWSSSEDHQMAIADRYLTWGWNDGSPKQFPVGALNRFHKRLATPNPKGHLLLVTSVLPRYSYVLGGYPTATSQTESYLQDQYDFAHALPKHIHDQMVIRLFVPDWGWEQPDRWRAEFPDAHIDLGTAPIESLVQGSRLYVATYNATAFLESLSQDIPTVVFWNPLHWEFRPTAEPYLSELERAGIFYPTPKAAALKVTEVWDDVAGWWRNPEVQRARIRFVERFARTPQSPIADLRHALTSVGHTSSGRNASKG